MIKTKIIKNAKVLNKSTINGDWSKSDIKYIKIPMLINPDTIEKVYIERRKGNIPLVVIELKK